MSRTAKDSRVYIGGSTRSEVDVQYSKRLLLWNYLWLWKRSFAGIFLLNFCICLPLCCAFTFFSFTSCRWQAEGRPNQSPTVSFYKAPGKVSAGNSRACEFVCKQTHKWVDRHVGIVGWICGSKMSTSLCLCRLVLSLATVHFSHVSNWFQKPKDWGFSQPIKELI